MSKPAPLSDEELNVLRHWCPWATEWPSSQALLVRLLDEHRDLRASLAQFDAKPVPVPCTCTCALADDSAPVGLHQLQCSKYRQWWHAGSVAPFGRGGDFGQGSGSHG